MSTAPVSDLKTGTFATAGAVARKTAAVKTVQVKVDHKAATRQAIIVAIRAAKVTFKTRSDWKAKEVAKSPDADWDYVAAAIHHAGNSYSCSADGADSLRKAEATDIGSFGHLSYHYAIDCAGVIYEALDIRFKGAHVEGGNTGVIGIVFLTDMSLPGEAEQHGPGAAAVVKKRGIMAGVSEWMGEVKDNRTSMPEKPSAAQLLAVKVLVTCLLKHFKIAKLGGHREFAKTHGTSRACPGKYGLEIAASLRKDLKLAAP